MFPMVILNAGMTLDGKIATRKGDSRISGPRDLERVHGIRCEVDAIMVGVGTVLADNPRLTSHRVPDGKNPLRIVVDSKGRTPMDSRVLDGTSPTIIALSEKAPEERIREISGIAEVIICGKDIVDLKCLLERLGKKGIRSILLEGGGTLNWSMIKEGLVDQVRVAVSPVIVGGKDAKTLVDGSGYESVEQGMKLKLSKYYPLDRDFILEYEVINK